MEGYRSYKESNGISWGAVLVGLGVVFLLFRIIAPTGAIPVLILGAIFTGLAIGGVGRGFTVPGGILLGLGAGLIASRPLSWLSAPFGPAAVVAGLGIGFWLIYLIDRLRHPYDSHFGFARVPGIVLLAIAAFIASFGLLSIVGHLFVFLLQWWPLLLIAGGIILFLEGRRRGTRTYRS